MQFDLRDNQRCRRISSRRGTTARPRAPSSSSSSASPTEGANIRARSRSASRSSTTTARSGAKSPCPSRRTSYSRRSARWRSAIRRCARGSPGRPSSRRTTAGWAASSTSTTAATTASSRLMAARAAAAYAGATSRTSRRARPSFLGTAKNPRLDRPYVRCIYQPMVDLLATLEAHGFTNYIVTGGGHDFMRAVAEPYYGFGRPRHRQHVGAQVPRRRRRSPRWFTSPSSVSSTTARTKPVADLAARPGGGRSSPAETRTATSRCSTSARTRRARRSALLVEHDDERREFAYESGAEESLARARKSAGRSPASRPTGRRSSPPD